jgi:23S rRNA (cytidine1920-2'-O)/16S rRNA (cytidine1409-2'-O)-methyltransferase
MPDSPETFVSRAGGKLAAALDALEIDVSGRLCVDLGCNVGGFTDCLLQRGAARVYAVDTGYGTLAWKLRRDPRVVVMERTNALYCQPAEAVDLAVVDVGWTPQRLILPAAARWLKPGGQILSLLKPHYEAADRAGPDQRAGRGGPSQHVLTSPQARQECLLTCQQLTADGWDIRDVVPSPLPGAGGNEEFLLHVYPSAQPPAAGP